MAYAIKLFFDKKRSKIVSGFWEKIKTQGVSSHMAESGYRPHITLLGMESTTFEECKLGLSELCSRYSQIPLRAEAIGVFPNEPSTVYLSITLSELLYEFHHALHQSSQRWANNHSEYYLPGSWTPHLTLACRLSQEEVIPVVKETYHLKLPISLLATSLALVAIPSAEVQFEAPLQALRS